jgi:hypothetical protein
MRCPPPRVSTLCVWHIDEGSTLCDVLVADLVVRDYIERWLYDANWCRFSDGVW